MKRGFCIVSKHPEHCSKMANDFGIYVDLITNTGSHIELCSNASRTQVEFLECLSHAFVSSNIAITYLEHKESFPIIRRRSSNTGKNPWFSTMISFNLWQLTHQQPINISATLSTATAKASTAMNANLIHETKRAFRAAFGKDSNRMPDICKNNSHQHISLFSRAILKQNSYSRNTRKPILFI